MRWKIYYADGAEFSSEDGTPEEAPALGVLIICMSDPDTGRRRQTNSDYYVWMGNRWFGVDIGGLYMHCLEQDWLRYDGNTKLVKEGDEWIPADIIDFFNYVHRKGIAKFGKIVRTRDFGKAIKLADEDPFFEPRTGWRRDEVRLGN